MGMQEIARYIFHLLEYAGAVGFFAALIVVALAGLAIGFWLDRAPHRRSRRRLIRPAEKPVPMDGQIRL